MDCKEASILIMESIDNEITDVDKCNLDFHLKECEKCCEEFSMLQEAIREVEDLKIIDPPKELEDMVMMEINKERYKNKNKIDSKLIFIPLAILLLFIGQYIYLSFLTDIIIKQSFIRDILISSVIWITNLAINYVPSIIGTLSNLTQIIQSIPLYFYGLLCMWIILSLTAIVYGWNRVLRIRRN